MLYRQLLQHSPQLATRFGFNLALAERRCDVTDPNLFIKYYSPAAVNTELPLSARQQRILFLLPIAGIAGGIHSIVQECAAMRQLGVEAQIAIRPHNRHFFLAHYSVIDDIEQMLVNFDESYLERVVEGVDTLIATLYSSMALVKSMVERYPQLQPAYYIQDYEPDFFEPGSTAWQQAYDSYRLLPDTLCFAKTGWLANRVSKQHDVTVHQVTPSLDHQIYSPDPNAPFWLKREVPIRVAAMVRPETPRRGAARTMTLLKALADIFGNDITIDIFGTAEERLSDYRLVSDFRYHNHGELTRQQVARLLQQSHFFLDLSDYQAFGRTAVEAMACGVIVLITSAGAASEYIFDGVNGFLLDIDSPELLQRVTSIIECHYHSDPLRLNAIQTVSAYNPRSAALSELALLAAPTATFGLN
ncbi:glycosyltransferase [Ectothiorhodospiraceae bacterium BW-2]|nr:glycosyltransferase [Ectothiorhodospiraceae bacterium BW-2]